MVALRGGAFAEPDGDEKLLRRGREREVAGANRGQGSLWGGLRDGLRADEREGLEEGLGGVVGVEVVGIHVYRSVWDS